MKLAVVGSGNMGTALAKLAAQNGHEVRCWDHFPDVVESIRAAHRNERFLPGVELPSCVRADALLSRVVQDAHVIAVAVPSAYFKHVVQEFSPFALPAAVIVGAAKGLEVGSLKRLSEVYAEVSSHPPEYYVPLGGPAIASEFARGAPTCVVAGCRQKDVLDRLRTLWEGPTFHLFGCLDVAGVEWGGILKNVYVLGWALWAKQEQNAFGVYAAQVLREMKKWAQAFGAQTKTLEGPAGLGDFLATVLSPHSHNRRFAEALAEGGAFEEAAKKAGGKEPEGVRSALQIAAAAQEKNISLPLLQKIAEFLQNPLSRGNFRESVWKIFQEGNDHEH